MIGLQADPEPGLPGMRRGCPTRTGAMSKTFYELRTERLPGVHRLMVLEHPAQADRRQCWLQAILWAHQLLQRRPAARELHPVSRKTACKLVQAGVARDS